MEWSDLVTNEELDLSVKIVTRKTALLLRLDAKLIERLKWRDKRVKVQVSLTGGMKRIRLVSAATGWPLVEKKGRGAEVSVRQLLPSSSYTRKCEASVESDALIVVLPDDFELKNSRMVLQS